MSKVPFFPHPISLLKMISFFPDRGILNKAMEQMAKYINLEGYRETVRTAYMK
jgi:hypothetical protein